MGQGGREKKKKWARGVEKRKKMGQWGREKKKKWARGVEKRKKKEVKVLAFPTLLAMICTCSFKFVVEPFIRGGEWYLKKCGSRKILAGS